MSLAELPAREVEYPERDGNPRFDNTLQFEWITTIQGGLDALFRNDPDVFVAGDLLWYPVEGNPALRCAPDVLVAFGRPKGHRGSYLQWKEAGIAPQVVFEILSPGNRIAEMTRKFHFYEKYGAEEYYIYDPDRKELSGWTRSGNLLEEVETISGWVSPRLGVRFEIGPAGLQLYSSDGTRFRTYVELAEEANRFASERDAERERADRLAARLRELGVEPD